MPKLEKISHQYGYWSPVFALLRLLYFELLGYIFQRRAVLVWNPRQYGVHSWYFMKQCSALSESLLNQSPNLMLMEHCADAQISSEVAVLIHHDCWRSYRIYHMSKMHTRGRPHSTKTQQWIWPHENKRQTYSYGEKDEELCGDFVIFTWGCELSWEKHSPSVPSTRKTSQ